LPNFSSSDLKLTALIGATTLLDGQNRASDEAEYFNVPDYPSFPIRRRRGEESRDELVKPLEFDTTFNNLLVFQYFLRRN
jgi:hypothetical protein